MGFLVAFDRNYLLLLAPELAKNRLELLVSVLRTPCLGLFESALGRNFLGLLVSELRGNNSLGLLVTELG